MRAATSPHDFKLMVAAAVEAEGRWPGGRDPFVERPRADGSVGSPGAGSGRVRARRRRRRPLPRDRRSQRRPPRAAPPGAVGAAAGRHLLS